MQPFGQVPALEDGDLKLFESRAITRYIAHNYADKGTPLILNDPKQMAVMAVGMEVEAHQFNGPAMKLGRELMYKPLFLKMETDEAVVEEEEVALAKVLDLYEARLSECKYLSGDTFTLTDLHHLPVLEYLMATRMKVAIEACPHVSAWCANIRARPAWQKVVAMKNNQGSKQHWTKQPRC